MRSSDDGFSHLMQRARDGDRLAIEQLVCLYEAEVRVIARIGLGAPLRPYLDTVDLVQSVHRSLLTGLARQVRHLNPGQTGGAGSDHRPPENGSQAAPGGAKSDWRNRPTATKMQCRSWRRSRIPQAIRPLKPSCVTN